MNPSNILNLEPKGIICPFCGEVHSWKGWGNSIKCTNCAKGTVKINYDSESKKISYSTTATCLRAYQVMKGELLLSDLEVCKSEPQIRFYAPFTSEQVVNSLECSGCDFKKKCTYRRLGDEGDGRHMQVPFGLVYDEEEYYSVLKKGNSMNNRIFERIWKHAPEENFEIVKKWAEKYKSTLQWAVPVVSIYAAYQILKSPAFSTRLEKLGNECEEKLGFTLEPLKDKKALRELMVLGGTTATAYAAIKGVSSIFKTDEDITSESIEDGMGQLEKIHKKFSWITPKTEKLLPVAISVLIFYMMTMEKKADKVETVKEIAKNLMTKIVVYVDLAKYFVADKMKIDLDNEEEVQKLKRFTLLAGVAMIGMFLYGAKTTGELEEKKADGKEKFFSQLLDIMKKLMPTVFAGTASYLAAKNLLAKEYAEDQQQKEAEIIDADGDAD